MAIPCIISAVRTPIGRFGGALKDLTPSDLCATVMKAALERAGVSGEDLDIYIFGNVLRAGHGQLIPRQAAIKAGVPPRVDGYAVDMVCSSGMMSVMNAATMIRSGEAELVLAGGVESMSQTGFFLSSRARWGYKFLLGSGEELVDILLKDGLTDPVREEAMGTQAERLLREHAVRRDELDAVAAESHRRAAEATDSGAFSDELVPVEISTRHGAGVFTVDEGLRRDTSLESLAALRPAFEKDGLLTPGNSSQISDGAAALLLASEETAARRNLKPIARLLAGSWIAGETWRFPEAPIPAVEKVLRRTDLSISDFDLFENNEAFALNNILFSRMLDVPLDRLNVHGGAIALGHPIGASGARIITTLVHALRRRDGLRGLAAICHGTGGGTAVALELA